MIRFPRLRSSQVLAVVAAAAAVGAISTGLAVAAPATAGYKACANASHRLALQNSRGHCPRHFSKVTLGAQGPSGVVSMTQYAPSGATPIPGGLWGFLGAPPAETFVNSHTAAQVIGTVDEASHDGLKNFDEIGVCYEPVGGSTVTNVSLVAPEFQAPVGNFFAQTVSGAIGNLAPGRYLVGLCARDQLDVDNGAASVTILMAQTSSGVTHPAAPATAHGGPNR